MTASSWALLLTTPWWGLTGTASTTCTFFPPDYPASPSTAFAGQELPVPPPLLEAARHGLPRGPTVTLVASLGSPSATFALPRADRAGEDALLGLLWSECPAASMDSTELLRVASAAPTRGRRWLWAWAGGDAFPRECRGTWTHQCWSAFQGLLGAG